MSKSQTSFSLQATSNNYGDIITQITMEILSPRKVYYVLLLSKGEKSEYHVQGSR